MKQKKEKILIIKVGYSETLDPEVSNITSYGDVLRTTVLLNLYKRDDVTWLVDEKAYPILKDNTLIDRVLIYNPTSVSNLQSECYDRVINLEKVPGLCALSDRIAAHQRYGFCFDEKTGQVKANNGTEKALSICYDEKRKKNHNGYWQEHLFEMVESRWQGEEYVFSYKGTTSEVYDVGFNFVVGNKWPTKAWPMAHWEKLEALSKGIFSVSWQRGLDDMKEYFEWINSCRVIVSNDSFGLHLAIALKKKVVGLFGPTNPKETFFYGRGTSITAEKPDCNYFVAGAITGHPFVCGTRFRR